MDWFTADLHLGHGNIMRYTGRPFDTVEQMDDRMMANINERVGQDDVLWVLGDFAMRLPFGRLLDYRKRIVCRHVNLIHGNHDARLKDDQWHQLFEFDNAYYDGLHSPRGQRIVMCHYPISDWNGRYRGSYMLHGHIHSRGMGHNDRNAAQGLRLYDVGVDAHGYTPVSMEEIEEYLEAVEVRF